MLINKISKLITMKKGIILFAGFILSFMLSAVFASAVQNLTASISNPRMVLYNNITKGEILEFENSVIVNNVNSYDVDIKIAPLGIWKNKIILKEESFALAKGEREEVFYTIKIDKAGYYQGDVLVSFDDLNSNNYISLAQDLVVIVSDENGKVPGNIENNTAGFGKKLIIGLVSAVILLAILILLAIIKTKRKK